MSQTTFEQEARSKQIHPDCIEGFCQRLRNKGKSIAFINGAFDILHKGHLHILFEAKKQADVLIVALNVDASIKKSKGSMRPIHPLDDRMMMLCAIEFVTFVTWFSDADPRALIKKVCPDVHINGSEYGSDCIEAQTLKEVGARLHIVELLKGNSTTRIVKKIQPCG